ncbi:MAG: dodecin family protein [Pyrinomonadaceae bacterium]
MSVAKNIEITSTSATSFEDAIRRGIERANDSVNNIRGAWIKDQKVKITGGKVSQYEVMMIVTFVLDDSDGKESKKAKGKSKK